MLASIGFKVFVLHLTCGCAAVLLALSLEIDGSPVDRIQTTWKTLCLCEQKLPRQERRDFGVTEVIAGLSSRIVRSVTDRRDLLGTNGLCANDDVWFEEFQFQGPS